MRRINRKKKLRPNGYKTKINFHLWIILLKTSLFISSKCYGIIQLVDTLCIPINIFMIIALLIFCWTQPIEIPGSDSGDAPCIAVDKNNRIHVVWVNVIDEVEHCHAFYSCYDGDSWSTPVDITPNAVQANNLSITTDTFGHPHITWTDFVAYAGELYYTSYNGTTWVGPVRMPDIMPYTNALGTSRILCDSRNRIHLVWSSVYDASIENIEVFYTRLEGDTWWHPVKISDDPQYSAIPDMALDKNLNLHVVWMDYTGTFGVKYSVGTGDSWSTPVLLPDPTDGQSCEPTIAVDTNNTPHVVWEERAPYPTYVFIAYTYCKDSEWTGICTLSTLDNNAWEPKIACNSTNAICVVWDQGSPLWYRFYKEGVWSDPDSIVGSSRGICKCLAVHEETFHLVWDRYKKRVRYSKHCFSPIEERKSSDQIDWNVLPNPACGSIKIEYVLPAAMDVEIKIFDVSGRLIRGIAQEYKFPGRYRCEFRDFTTGVYFIRLSAGKITCNKKIVLIRR